MEMQRNLRRRFLVVSISTISHSSITSRNILTSFVLTRKTKEGRKETTKEFLFFGKEDLRSKHPPQETQYNETIETIQDIDEC